MSQTISHANEGERFVAEYRANADILTKAGIDLTEHDACGVGLVAALDGKPRREVVVAGIEALKVLWHRGAVDADGKTGDGAGIQVELPQDFFADQVRHRGHEPWASRAPHRPHVQQCGRRSCPDALHLRPAGRGVPPA